MYINLKEATAKAERLNCTIGAFNAHNLEMLPSIIGSSKRSRQSNHYSNKCGYC
ncbi:hypothetical protein NIT60_07480 [Mammaliicoccus sciuri]|nr:hypothetical protein NIT60_07480 [Mammaliicoccus sciuri]